MSNSGLLAAALQTDPALPFFGGYSCVLRFGIRQQLDETIVLTIDVGACSRCSRIRLNNGRLPGHFLPLWYKADLHTQFVHFLVTAEKWLQSPAGWRIQLLGIVIGEPKAPWKGMNGFPPYLEKKCVSTSLM